jgi:hypothetical protein
VADEVARKRFPIGLPPWHEKRLIWWAFIKGASKTGLAQNILQARIEASDPLIQDGLRELAEDEGISMDDLKARLLKGTAVENEDDGG